MTDKKTRADETVHLRQQAEALFDNQSTRLDPIVMDNQQLVHELQVHQIELEMQNEELRRSEAELEAERARYFSLYNLAPVGYLTLNEKWQILESNLSAAGMLGLQRSKLVQRSFSHFIQNEYQDSYYLMQKQLLKTKNTQALELCMKIHDSHPIPSCPAPGNKKDSDGVAGRTTIWVHLTISIVKDSLTSSADPDSREMPLFFVMLSDINERKRIEQELEKRVLVHATDMASANRILEKKFLEVLEVQKSLQQGRDKLEQLFELLPVGVSVLDQEHRLVKTNPALQTILGMTSEGLSAGQYKNRRYFRPDGSLRPVEEFASTRILNGETQALHVETGVEKEDGSMVWANVSAVLGLFEDWSTVIVTTDITQRKQAENEILNHTARAETLVRTGVVLASKLELGNMLQTVCLEAAQVLKAPAVNIFLCDTRDVEMTLAGSFGPPADFMKRSQSFPKVLIEQIAARHGIDKIGVLPIAQFLDQFNIQLFSEMGLQSVVVVKIIHDQKLVGLLNVFSPDEGGHFSAAGQRLLLSLADQVAQAVVNIRLFEQVKTGQQRLRKLTQALIDTEENERRSLALELHDQLGQMLSTVKMSLDMIPALPRADAGGQLERAGKLVSDMIARVRRLTLDLRPSILDDRGLLPALLYLFKSFQTQNGEVVTFKHSGLELRFPPKVETTAYRIIQEGLTNVLRHAGKSQVVVYAWADGQYLNLQIRDDGVGFDPTVSLKGVSSGLSGMRERVRLLGGELEIESVPGEGTALTAMLPVMIFDENV